MVLRRWKLGKVVALGGALAAAVAGCSLMLDTESLKKGSGAPPDGGTGASAGTGGASGGAAGTAGSGGGDVTAACAALSSALCTKYGDCADFFVRVTFGTKQVCEQRLAKICTTYTGIEDSTFTADNAAQCAGAVKSLTCDDLFAGDPIARACQPPAGPRAEGAKCVADGQCVTLYCRAEYGQPCGTCQHRSAEGGLCAADKDCQPGYGCVGDAPKKCAKLRGVGESCDKAAPCLKTLSCRGSPLACGPPPLVNEPCDYKLQNCNQLEGQFCCCGSMNPKCQQAGLSKANDKCNVIALAPPDLRACESSGICTEPMLASAKAGTCVGAAEDGKPCDLNKNIGCMTPSECIGGVCGLRDPAACK
jgi:hypothetical protein